MKLLRKKVRLLHVNETKDLSDSSKLLFVKLYSTGIVICAISYFCTAIVGMPWPLWLPVAWVGVTCAGSVVLLGIDAFKCARDPKLTVAVIPPLAVGGTVAIPLTFGLICLALGTSIPLIEQNLSSFCAMYSVATLVASAATIYQADKRCKSEMRPRLLGCGNVHQLPTSDEGTQR